MRSVGSQSVISSDCFFTLFNTGRNRPNLFICVECYQLLFWNTVVLKSSPLYFHHWFLGIIVDDISSFTFTHGQCLFEAFYHQTTMFSGIRFSWGLCWEKWYPRSFVFLQSYIFSVSVSFKQREDLAYLDTKDYYKRN